MEENIIYLDKKITEYDYLYKKWCRKIDLVIKSIVIKFQDKEKEINNLEEDLNKKIKKLKFKMHKQNKIILYLVNKSKEKTFFSKVKEYIINNWIIMFQIIVFFITVYYINGIFT